MTEAPSQIPAIRARREKYLTTGDPQALDESVSLGRSTVARLAGLGALEGSAALELAASLGVLYDADGQLYHIEEALNLLDRAARVLPPGHADLAAVHTNRAGALKPSTQAPCMVLATLAGSLQARALRTLSGTDLAASIATAKQAVASAPPGSCACREARPWLWPAKLPPWPSDHDDHRSCACGSSSS